MTQPNLLQRAKQGDVFAIEILVNLALRGRGIVAEVQLNRECLNVSFRCDRPLNQVMLVSFIRKGLLTLAVTSIQSATLRAYQTNATLPAWTAEFSLHPPLLRTENRGRRTETEGEQRKSGVSFHHHHSSSIPCLSSLLSHLPSIPTAYLVLLLILIASSTLSGGLFAAVRYCDAGNAYSARNNQQTLGEQNSNPVAGKFDLIQVRCSTE
jgi:hypothetical protein